MLHQRFVSFCASQASSEPERDNEVLHDTTQNQQDFCISFVIFWFFVVMSCSLEASATRARATN